MRRIIESYVSLTDDEYQALLSFSKSKNAKRNDIIFRPGTISRKYLFIINGLLRGYRIIEGKEYTHHFYLNDWFATDYKSYLIEQPSDLYIQSLTDVEYFEFDKKDLLELFNSYHQFEKLGRIIAEKAYLLTVDKLEDIQTLSLKQRYLSLIQKSPELFQQVPQKYIASYLGVSEQSLSRIKSSLL